MNLALNANAEPVGHGATTRKLVGPHARAADGNHSSVFPLAQPREDNLVIIIILVY